MKISAKCDYACRAIIELAGYWPNNIPLRMQTISKKQSIPLKYIPQILLQLKGMGIVRSVRGKEGGYLLARAPREITLGEIVVEMGDLMVYLPSGNYEGNNVFAAIWKDVENTVSKTLDKISFEDILKKAGSTAGTMAYQI